ncbi:MAG: CCA tRNA nucleotidyltransferase [Thermosphaera sp.]
MSWIVEEEVLAKIKPSKEEYELVKTVFERISNTIGEVSEASGLAVEVTLQGSIAHDTWLSGDRDLDVFVLFPTSLSLEELKTKGFNILLEAAKRLGAYELRFAEHPYVRVFINGVEADLVPAFKVSDPGKIISAVDRTPFHTIYVNQALSHVEKDQVRLLKKFMKTVGIYGAELKTKGFSGYAVELLIAKYKSFRNVLEQASQWDIPIFINTVGEGFSENLKNKLKRKYPESVMFLPDPVDPMRNVTANVSIRALSTFILASRCFLKRPDTSFFEPERPRLQLNEIMKHSLKRCIIVLKYSLSNPPPPDVLWGELQRVENNIVNALKNHDFEPIDSSSWSDEKTVAFILLETSSCELPAYKLYIGPRASIKERSDSFVAKHAEGEYGPWIGKDGRLRSLRKRKSTDIVAVLKELMPVYNVPPHLKQNTPEITRLSPEIAMEIVEKRGEAWLAEFILKKPLWMEKCIG